MRSAVGLHGVTRLVERLLPRHSDQLFSACLGEADVGASDRDTRNEGDSPQDFRGCSPAPTHGGMASGRSGALKNLSSGWLA